MTIGDTNDTMKKLIIPLVLYDNKLYSKNILPKAIKMVEYDNILKLCYKDESR